MNIFISYAHADEKWVHDLVSLLRETGLILNWYNDLSPGEHWLGALREKIESAELVIAVLTKQSLQSPTFLFELGAATAARRQVLAMLVATNGELPSVPAGITGQSYLKVESPQDAAMQVKQYVSEQMAGV